MKELREVKVLQKKFNELIERYGYNRTAKMLGYTNGPTLLYWKKIGRIPYNGQVALNNLMDKRSKKNEPTGCE